MHAQYRPYWPTKIYGLPPRRRKLRRAHMPQWGRALPRDATADKVLSDDRAARLVLDTLLAMELRHER